MANESNAEVAVLIGRFQPFHAGHAALLTRALAIAQKVVVVLGSAFNARSAKHPFTWEERSAMIRATLSEQDRQRVVFAPLRDYYDDTRWAEAVRQCVARHAAGAHRVALVGHYKDASSYYLNHFPQWQLDPMENLGGIDASAIRRILFEAEDIDISISVLEGSVPGPVRQYLKAWTALPHYPGLAQEHRQVAQYKAQWKSAPYPPIFSTVDAVVITAGHVLLIRRAGFPGKGQWALPGGFLDQRERLLQAAIRELIEETSLGLLETTLAGALAGVSVFDHPDRSQRGRTITHAHFFDLKTDHLPEVRAADDAADAQWHPVAKLADMEEEFFEDHFHILDHFLQLTSD